MKPSKTNPLFSNFFRRNVLATAVVVSLAGFGTQPSALAGTLYWDANGTAPGSGDVGGSWDGDAFWSTDASGLSATGEWEDGENAVFSADTDGVGGWEVAISGAIATPSIMVEEAGGKTLSGGTNQHWRRHDQHGGCG